MFIDADNGVTADNINTKVDENIDAETVIFTESPYGVAAGGKTKWDELIAAAHAGNTDGADDATEYSELVAVINDFFGAYITAIEKNKDKINVGISPENMPCVKDDADGCNGCATGFICGLDTMKEVGEVDDSAWGKLG